MSIPTLEVAKVIGRIVNTYVSDEIDSLFDKVPVAMDNSSVCVVDNGV